MKHNINALIPVLTNLWVVPSEVAGDYMVTLNLDLNTLGGSCPQVILDRVGETVGHPLTEGRPGRRNLNGTCTFFLRPSPTATTLRHLARILVNQDLRDGSGCEVFDLWPESDVRSMAHSLHMNPEEMGPSWYESMKPLYAEELSAATA